MQCNKRTCKPGKNTLSARGSGNPIVAELTRLYHMSKKMLQLPGVGEQVSLREGRDAGVSGREVSLPHREVRVPGPVAALPARVVAHPAEEAEVSGPVRGVSAGELRIRAREVRVCGRVAAFRAKSDWSGESIAASPLSGCARSAVTTFAELRCVRSVGPELCNVM